MPERIFKYLILAALAISLAYGLLVAWVATGPRDIGRWTPYIELGLSDENNSFTTKIGETWLAWGGWRHPIDIRLKNVTIMTGQGEAFSSFPEISLSIDIGALPFGKVYPTAIAIEAPVISLLQNNDRTIRFGFGKFDLLAVPEQTAIPEEQATPAPPAFNTIPFAVVMEALLEPGRSSNLRRLRKVSVNNATITIGHISKGALFEITGAGVQAKRARSGGIKIFGSGKLLYANRQSEIGGLFTMSKEAPTIDGSINFQALDPGTLGKLFAESPVFRIVNVPLSGMINLSIDKEGALKQLLFDVNGDSGTINSDHLAGALPISSFHAEGQLADNANDITLDSLSANIGAATLTARGKVQIKDNDVAAQATLGLQTVPIAEAKLFWPPALAPESRAWVLENITGGAVPNATAKINIQLGDLAKPVLPKEAVDAYITLNDATVRYLPDHPPLKNLQGVVHVDGLSLEADIAGADALGASKLMNGKLWIDDLNLDNPYIKMGFDGTATAKDAVQFLSLPRLRHAKALNLDAGKAEGTASLRAALGFYFYAAEKGDDDIAYDITADLKDVASPGFMHKFDIANGNGSLAVNNRGIEFKGTGRVNGAAASQASVTYLFRPKDGFDTIIDVTARAPVESLPKFGYPALPFAKGELGVRANLSFGDNNERATADIDLADAALDVKSIGWSKPDKMATALSLEAESSGGGATRITSFKLSGANAEAAGSARLAKGFSGIEQLSLQNAKIGGVNLRRLEYENTGGSLRLEAYGPAADLSGWLDDDDDNASEFSFHNFPALQFKVDVARLVLSKQGFIGDFKGEMQCSERFCSAADIRGAPAGGKEFQFRILKNPNGKRQVSLQAPDAGLFLKAFGAYPNIEGGALALTGTYDDLPGGSLLAGKLLITDYTVKKAPILTKILSLASLTGVLDLLQGNGIRFDKLTAPFTLQNDVIRFSKGKARGDSIGITFKGTVTMPKRTLDLEGTVVPAYSLNSMVGKVPVLGTLLTGGEGKGVIAISYGVKGTEQNPDVSVNPLSILAPGFLKNLFESEE